MLTSAQHVFMFLWIIGSGAAEESLRENATPGEDVLLRCNSSTDAAVTLVEWSRPELERSVFFFRDNRQIESFHDPRYRGRVQLKDPEMKNGDASVVLKKVNIEDTGTYQCWVITPSNNRRKRNVGELVSSVNLTISEESLRENVKPGEDVLLQCNSSTDAAITVLEWSRPGLERPVFYFRGNRLIESFQDPRYRGRVQLSDPEMKNGDASVVLKYVTIEDTGTYECRVITPSNNRRKRNVREFVRSVHLTVSEGPEKEINDEYHQNGDANDEHPGGSRGHVGLGVSVGVGVGVVCLVGLVGVGVGVFRLKNKKSQRVKVKGSEECLKEVLSTPGCPPSPASKLNLLPESLPCRGGGAY